MIRLGGVPPESTTENIKKFFSGLKIAEGGINFLFHDNGRTFRDVFVEFNWLGETLSALEQDGSTLLNHPITLRKASTKDLDRLLFANMLNMEASGYLVSPKLLKYIESVCLKPKRDQLPRGFEVLITLLKRIPWSKASQTFVNDLCQVTLIVARALRKRVVAETASPELFKVFVDVSLNSQGFLNSHLARLYLIFFNEAVSQEA